MPLFTRANMYPLFTLYLRFHAVMNSYGMMEILNFIDFLVRPGIWSVDTCDDSIVLPSGSLDDMLFYILTEPIFVVALFAICE